MNQSPWPQTPLRALLEAVRVSNVNKKSLPSEKPVLLCNYTDVYSNAYLTNAIDFMKATASSAEIGRFALARNDILITKDSESPDDIGVPAVVVEHMEGVVCGYHLALLRPRPGGINSVYLAKQLRSVQSRRYFGVTATGTTRFGLPVGAIEEMPIPLAPSNEQDKIAHILTTLDVAIDQTADLLAKRRRTMVALMQSLLSRGVDDEGVVRNESTHKFKTSELGSIPSSWEVTTIGDQFTQRSERGRAGLPLMSVVMNRGLVERRDVERRVASNLPPEAHALVCANDIAYNMMRMWQGVLGRADFDCLVSPAYVVLKPGGNIDPRFAEWLFRDERTVREFRRASRGVVDDRLRLYPDDLFRIPVAIPSDLDEQARIVSRLDAIKRLVALESARLAKYQRMRPGLNEELLAGSRRVTALLETDGSVNTAP